MGVYHSNTSDTFTFKYIYKDTEKFGDFSLHYFLSRYLCGDMALKNCRQVSRKRISLLQADVDIDDVQAKHLLSNIQSYNQAVSSLVSEPLSMKILCNIHQPLSVDKRISGRIRPTQNWVGESLENATYVPPPPEDVTRLLNELLIFCNSKAEHTLDKCIECYARFVCIHPFADGNGRIARALFHTLLIKYGLDSVHLSLFRLRVPPVRYSNAIWAFGVTSEEGSKHPYWLEAKAWTAEYKINATNTLSAAQKIIFAKLGFSAITAEDKATLNYLWAQPLITPTLLQGTFGWSFTTVKASIEKLLQLGVLKRYQVKSSQNQSIFVCEDIFTCWEQLDELIFANGNKKK